MDTLSGNQTGAQTLALTDRFEQALAAEDPAALLQLLHKCPAPLSIGMTPWPVILSRKVAITRWWSASTWQSEHCAGWLAAWRQQPPIPGTYWPEIFLDALCAMGRCEARYKLGRMYHSQFIAWIDEMIGMGLDINGALPFGPKPCNGLDYLLETATLFPYVEIALYWIDRHGAEFSPKGIESALELMERLHTPEIKKQDAHRLIRHLVLFLEDYSHQTHLKISTWFDTLAPSMREGDLEADINRIFIEKGTRHQEGAQSARRL